MTGSEAIVDVEYVADWGAVGDCHLCGDPIEHGDIRVKIVVDDDNTAWTHQACSEEEGYR